MMVVKYPEILKLSLKPSPCRVLGNDYIYDTIWNAQPVKGSFLHNQQGQLFTLTIRLSDLANRFLVEFQFKLHLVSNWTLSSRPYACCCCTEVLTSACNMTGSLSWLSLHTDSVYTGWRNILADAAPEVISGRRNWRFSTTPSFHWRRSCIKIAHISFS
jgi:hypothetical protein